jgi:hypothetical protein
MSYSVLSDSFVTAGDVSTASWYAVSSGTFCVAVTAGCGFGIVVVVVVVGAAARFSGAAVE